MLCLVGCLLSQTQDHWVTGDSKEGMRNGFFIDTSYLQLLSSHEISITSVTELELLQTYDRSTVLALLWPSGL